MCFTPHMHTLVLPLRTRVFMTRPTNPPLLFVVWLFARVVGGTSPINAAAMHVAMLRHHAIKAQCGSMNNTAPGSDALDFVRSRSFSCHALVGDAVCLGVDHDPCSQSSTLGTDVRVEDPCRGAMIGNEATDEITLLPLAVKRRLPKLSEQTVVEQEVAVMAAMVAPSLHSSIHTIPTHRIMGLADKLQGLEHTTAVSPVSVSVTAEPSGPRSRNPDITVGMSSSDASVVSGKSGDREVEPWLKQAVLVLHHVPAKLGLLLLRQRASVVDALRARSAIASFMQGIFIHLFMLASLASVIICLCCWICAELAKPAPLPRTVGMEPDPLNCVMIVPSLLVLPRVELSREFEVRDTKGIDKFDVLVLRPKKPSNMGEEYITVSHDDQELTCAFVRQGGKTLECWVVDKDGQWIGSIAGDTSLGDATYTLYMHRHPVLAVGLCGAITSQTLHVVDAENGNPLASGGPVNRMASSYRVDCRGKRNILFLVLALLAVDRLVSDATDLTSMSPCQSEVGCVKSPSASQ